MSHIDSAIERLLATGRCAAGRGARGPEIAEAASSLPYPLPEAIRALWSSATDMTIDDLPVLSPGTAVERIVTYDHGGWGTARRLRLIPIIAMGSDHIMVGCAKPLSDWVFLDTHDAGIYPVSSSLHEYLEWVARYLEDHERHFDQLQHFNLQETRFCFPECGEAEGRLAEHLADLAREPYSDPLGSDFESVIWQIRSLALRLVGPTSVETALDVMTEDSEARSDLMKRVNRHPDSDSARRIIERDRAGVASYRSALEKVLSETDLGPAEVSEDGESITVDSWFEWLTDWQGNPEIQARDFVSRILTLRARDRARAQSRSALLRQWLARRLRRGPGT